MSELSRETDALLERGRDGEALHAGDKARLKRALVAQVGALSVVTTGSTASAWTAVTATKIVGAVVLAATVTGGAAMLAPWHPDASTAGSRTIAPRGVPTAANAQSARVVPAPSAPASAETRVAPPAVSATVTPRAAAPARTDNAGDSPAAPAHAPSGSFASSLEAEARLLGEADDALKTGDPDRALQILDDLGARFPTSSLAPERAAVRVFALCMAGRPDEARRAATAFDALDQAGPLAERVRASCAGRP